VKTATSRRSIIDRASLKAAHPDFDMSSMAASQPRTGASAIAHMDGVMMGVPPIGSRGVSWASIRCYRRSGPFATPRDAAMALIPYIERELSKGVRLNSITRMCWVFSAPCLARAFRGSGDRSGKAGASASVMVMRLRIWWTRPRICRTSA